MRVRLHQRGDGRHLHVVHPPLGAVRPAPQHPHQGLAQQHHLHRDDGRRVRLGLCGRLAGQEEGPHRHFLHERRVHRGVQLLPVIRTIYALQIPQRGRSRRQWPSDLVLLCRVPAEAKERLHAQLYGGLLDARQPVRGELGLAHHPQRHRLPLAHVPLQLVAHLPAAVLRAQLPGGGSALLPAGEPQVPPHAGPQRPGHGDLPAHIRDQHGQPARGLPGKGANHGRVVRSCKAGTIAKVHDGRAVEVHALRHRGQLAAAVHAAHPPLHPHFHHHQLHLPHRLLRSHDVVPGVVSPLRRV